MKAETELVESYWSMLRFLSDKMKMALVEKLQKSISKPKSEEKDRLKHSFGSWVGPESAEEIIDSISGSRNFSRKVEEF
ncbi:hypothetical protein SAMN03080617_01835 [Algoriphagus alkaliphilus]|uniref:Uncharacterized protein n=1 Tax=Algoriphagus alkaliphilus TaxID=279824 RepID=A0A1G5XKD6_9BACT|nr:hypothetical protein [Algoriphagus alkaliphilus]MBA4302405.1 hypothetical protein [Cyclobacterium sp.]SDA70921.1 hypothetical protein SAMN03080617_01835 [Algoriphagus alkaliphilus]